MRVLPCSHLFHTECILPWLVERQGCCPMCKKPVLPEELQRGNNTGSVGRSSPMRGLRVGARRHQPQLTPDAAAPSTLSLGGNNNSRSLSPTVSSSVRFMVEIESDSAAFAQVVTPDGSPLSPASSIMAPLGTAGGSIEGEDRDDDIVVLEQRRTAPGPDYEPHYVSGESSDDVDSNCLVNNESMNNELFVNNTDEENLLRQSVDIASIGNQNDGTDSVSTDGILREPLATDEIIATAGDGNAVADTQQVYFEPSDIASI